MTNTVLIKRSGVANSVPVAGDLQSGELAINYRDGNLFYKNVSNVVTVIASNQFVSVVGNITGGNANITGTTTSTSKTTGALTVAGGVGVAGDLYAGNSITVDGGAYGNVVTTQFASVFASGSGPNPRSIMQVRGADGVAGIGIQAYSGLNGQIYANTGITFTTGSTLRDKDYPTGGTTRATLDSTGLSVTGIVSATGNVTGGNLNATGLSLSGNVLSAINLTANVTTTANVYANNITATTSINIAGATVATVDDAAALAIALG
jgi:hypothetical protein